MTTRGQRAAGLLAITWLIAACGATAPSPSSAAVAAATLSASPPAATPAPTPAPAVVATPMPTVAATSLPSPAPTAAPTAAATPTPRPDPSATPRPKLDDRGCPLGGNASRHGLLRLHRTLVVGGRELPYDGTIEVWARNESYQASDQIPAYASLDLDMRPIVVDAGGRLELRETGATLTGLEGANRTPFDAYVDAGLPQYHGPDPRRLDAGAAGGVGWIAMPNRPGTWVIEFVPTWTTHCYGGSGINWVVVRTR